MTYQEPILSIFVLDFAKPIESRLCLESVKRHIKEIPYKVIFVDNGSGEDYPLQFVREGLVDQLIINRESTGLGLGTRDGMNACLGQVTLMLQNDQEFARDFMMPDFISLVNQFGAQTGDGRKVGSISLAGAPCGDGVYSERGHLISTRFYKDMERNGILGYHGAGPWHDGVWRERQIQDLYAREGLVHWTPPCVPWIKDNGVFAVRDGRRQGFGTWVHRTDLKTLWNIVKPEQINPAYPKLSQDEWAQAIRGEWPEEGKVPEAEIKDSFDCWSHTELGQMEKEYVANLRRRFGGRQ